jgi:hypothetical protein
VKYNFFGFVIIGITRVKGLELLRKNHMKKIKRKYIMAAAIMIFCAACAGVGAAYADEVIAKNNATSGLISAIASKFNLNQSDVQAVFDEQRSKMAADRQAKMVEMETKRQEEFTVRLSGLVTAGKLTHAQADAIKTKNAELKAAREANKADMESIKNKTADERQAAMEAQKTKMETERAALKKWASDNSIPEEYISMAGFMGGGRGRGRGFGYVGGSGQKQADNAAAN